MKTLRIAALLLLAALATQAQPYNLTQAQLTAAGTGCAEANCLLIALPANAATLAVQISGTFTATVQFEYTIDLLNWVSAATGTTGTGTWSFTVAGWQGFRARASSFSSGPVKVTFSLAQGGVPANVLTKDPSGNVAIGSTVLAPEISTPSNPASGYVVWYSKGGKLCSLSSVGVETCTGGAGGGASWGGITGTLSNQSDLNAALAGKQATLSNYSTISALTGYPSTFPPVVGTGATDAAAGNHNHTGVYQPLDAGLTALAGGSDFVAFSGPSTSTKMFTLPDASATLSYTVASGTATLGTGAIAANTCAAAVTVSATGVLTTDVISWTPNADISGVTGFAVASTDGLIIYPYPTANNVNFKVCNGTGSSITPGSAVTLNWAVRR